MHREHYKQCWRDGQRSRTKIFEEISEGMRTFQSVFEENIS